MSEQKNCFGDLSTLNFELTFTVKTKLNLPKNVFTMLEFLHRKFYFENKKTVAETYCNEKLLLSKKFANELCTLNGC